MASQHSNDPRLNISAEIDEILRGADNQEALLLARHLEEVAALIRLRVARADDATPGQATTLVSRVEGAHDEGH